MKRFSAFISEAARPGYSHEEIVKDLAAAKKAGEILNPQFQDLKYRATRTLEQAAPDIFGLIDNFRDDRDDDIMEIYYTSKSTFASLKKIQRLVDKVAKKKLPKYSKYVTAMQKWLKDWIPVGEDLKSLNVVKTTQKRAEAKVSASNALAKKFADSSSLIKIFESHLQEYKDMAEKRAREFVKERLDFLKKHDWDLNKAAPQPKSHYGGTDYRLASQRRTLLSALTKSKNSSRRYDEPDIREPDNAKIEHYVKLNVQGAEESYRAFMQKMIEKIGKPVTDAKMTGNIWTNAVLTVTTNDGEQQVWNTKMILNFSKYQKMFSQFPSRRKK